ncbi:GNAT family N-acetyltransferase [Flavobacterium sp. Fl-77]|uniref:GNAT family N-acetyltransferase n=1 Tax=Flavobacterium flavipigmentatum TaxID=2893884 RepID=A0AAJ2VW90_9FLAO|nr:MULTISPECIES: GNAT family N-acetyltransferase [unclassified Flavobacterium]MDX6182435.1 GNAT family N-acetyltransferase [Flavobacterium sp. Fl-33]MDX6185652.1 GNAT family N-acetyltransferase [Flavobacterium sp. Fl-77]UFH38837.1 GNAT family N-acetyltransferase [Flavobacterium sp. F-70]
MVLEKNNIRLVPIVSEDINELKKFAFDDKLWEFGLNKLSNTAELKAYINDALVKVESSSAIVWVIHNANETIGTTRIANIDCNTKTAQLGWTWINPKFQGTKVNKISKYLILQYVFEELNLEKIIIQIDKQNIVSNKAAQSIGAKLQEIITNHLKTWRGNYRDTNVYTIEKNDWQNIKIQLLNKIDL